VQSNQHETCVSKYLLSTWVPVVITWNDAVLVLCSVALDVHADSSNHLSETDFRWLKNDQNYTLYCKDPALYLYYYMDQSKASGQKFIVDMKQIGHIINVANSRSTKRALTGIKLEDSKDVLFLKKLSEKEQVAVLCDKVLDIIKSIDPKMTKKIAGRNSYHDKIATTEKTYNRFLDGERKRKWDKK
jgi:tetrahydromethanopterin S-methyltransferase subunit B